ncbi:MAG: hypothetical protein KTR16_16580 [Acidiferrobacterales bacterium]|nr:hypothetical protein [Acidiferrobacterales bacterium]
MMSELIRKTAVAVSLICYLAVSSIATGHSYPIFADDVGDKVETLVTTDEIAIVSMDDAAMPDCHSSATPQSGQSESATCKIFCSVMAQAMSEASDEMMSIGIVPSVKMAPFHSKVLTRLVAVEPHPPK